MFSDSLMPAPSEQRFVQSILARTSLCAAHGVSLTQADAESIARTHIRALSDNRLVEIGCGSVEKILDAFAPSPYVTQENFASVAECMSEAFCYLKREADREIRDGIIIAAMRAVFERCSHGSEELFLSRDLDRLRNALRGRGDVEALMQMTLYENTLEFMETPNVSDRGAFLAEYFSEETTPAARMTEPEVWEEDRHGHHHRY